MQPSPREQYPGYPQQRLIMKPDLLQELSGIDIPLGPWDHNTTPLPSPEEIAELAQQGIPLDTLGRPVHPWAQELLTSEHGGMVTGKGAYWHWGPNKTADPIVITREDRPRILLITRSDTGALALPGGFLDGNEDPHTAAQRELQEETGFTADQSGVLVYQGPVADLRTTLHAWAETTAYLFEVDTAQAVRGNDDALNADWYYVDELPKALFGSHAMLVANARPKLNRPRASNCLCGSSPPTP